MQNASNILKKYISKQSNFFNCYINDIFFFPNIKLSVFKKRNRIWVLSRFRWQPINRLPCREQSMLFDLYKAFD